MRNFSMVSSVLLCLFAAPLALADDNAAARNAIQAIYRQIDAEDAGGDFNGYLHHGTNDFTMIPLKGKPISRNQIKPAQKKWKKGEGSDSKTSIVNLFLKGNEATVQVNNNTRVTFLMGQTPHTLLTAQTGEDVWVKNGNTWLIKRARMTGVKVSEIGGKKQP